MSDSTKDVPALRAEVERLRALSAEQAAALSVYRAKAGGAADALRVRGRSVTVDVAGCARCGGEHPGLVFDCLVGQENPHYSHWADCPETGHPILMLSLEDPDDSPPASPRR